MVHQGRLRPYLQIKLANEQSSLGEIYVRLHALLANWHHDTQHNDTQHNDKNATLSINDTHHRHSSAEGRNNANYAECRYSECRYSDCHGVIKLAKTTCQ